MRPVPLTKYAIINREKKDQDKPYRMSAKNIFIIIIKIERDDTAHRPRETNDKESCRAKPMEGTKRILHKITI